jgi:hypothetical protein
MDEKDIRQTPSSATQRGLAYVARLGALAMGYVFISRWLSHWLPPFVVRPSVAFVLWVGIYWIPPRPTIRFTKWIELSALAAVVVYVIALLLFYR